MQNLVNHARSLAMLLSAPKDLLENKRCAVSFLLRKGRFPQLTDKVKPWKYKSWLRLYVQALHAHAYSQTQFPDRWGYLFQILQTGELPEEGIPEVEFSSAHQNNEAFRATEKWIGLVDRAGGHWTGFRDFVRFLGYGLGVIDEAPDLSDEISEKLYREMNLGLWLKYPSDYLGTIAAERYKGGPHAFFPTPHDICEMMCRMTMHDMLQAGEDLRLKSTCDPAMGSGRMLLHASNFTLALAGQDIDEVMVWLTKINLCVYAPWGLYTVPHTLPARPEYWRTTAQQCRIKHVQKQTNAQHESLSIGKDQPCLPFLSPPASTP